MLAVQCYKTSVRLVNLVYRFIPKTESNSVSNTVHSGNDADDPLNLLSCSQTHAQICLTSILPLTRSYHGTVCST